MASLADILATVQQGVTAANGLVKQMTGSLSNIAGQLSLRPQLLNTLTANASAALSDTTSFTSSFSAYDIVFESLIPATNAVQAELLVHSGGTFQSSSYVALISSIANSNFTPGNSGAVTTYIPLSSAGDVTNGVAGQGISGTLRLHGPVSSSTITKPFAGLMINNTGNTMRVAQVGAFWNSTGVVDGIQFLFSTGNISSGTIKIYGVP